MTDQASEAATGSAPASSGDRPDWADDLKREILGAVHELVDPLKSGGAAQSAAQQHEAGKLGQPSRDLDAMIADAIKVNDEARARADADRSTADRLTAVEAATAEKPPVERGPLHRLMKWGEPSR